MLADLSECEVPPRSFRELHEEPPLPEGLQRAIVLKVGESPEPAGDLPGDLPPPRSTLPLLLGEGDGRTKTSRQMEGRRGGEPRYSLGQRAMMLSDGSSPRPDSEDPLHGGGTRSGGVRPAIYFQWRG